MDVPNMQENERKIVKKNLFKQIILLFRNDVAVKFYIN